MERLSDEKLQHMLDVAEGKPVPRLRLAFDPAHSSIYGGVSGADLPIELFELAPGLALRRTFAHVMAPYVMAFERPATRSQPHPGPWRAVRGGRGYDITVEVSLGEGARPTGFDRVNTIWWCVSLTRLVSGIPLFAPVLADTPFMDARYSEHEPELWPIDMARPLLRLGAEERQLDLPTLERVRAVLPAGARLMDSELFNRAYRVFDAAQYAHSPEVAAIMTWTMLETLVRPGRRDMGARLTKALATLLEPPGGGREALQQRLAQLYEDRGMSVHASAQVTDAAVMDTVRIGRRVLLAIIEAEALPDCEALIGRWASEHTLNTRRSAK